MIVKQEHKQQLLILQTVKPLYNTAIGREGREKRNRLAVKDVFEEIGKKYDSI
jgi:hypothetical protein